MDRDASYRVDCIESLAEIPADVVALFDTAEREFGMQAGLVWLRLIVRHVFANGNDVRIFVLRHRDSPVAVLPMQQSTRKSTQACTLENFYTALFMPIIAPWLKPSELVPLLMAVRQAWPNAGRLTFAPMDPNTREYSTLIAALGQTGFAAFRFLRFGNWVFDRGDVKWSEYLAGREGSVRNTLSRTGKKFSAMGGRLSVITSSDQIEEGIDAYERVYAASWKPIEPFPLFVRELVRTSADRGWLRLGVAWLGEKPVAAQIWITAHGRAEIFKLAYDESYKSLSAGSLLTARLMEMALDTDRVQEVDYLIGDDAYKRAWMSHRRERWGIVAFDPRKPAALLAMVRHLTGLVVHRARVAVYARLALTRR